MAAKLARRMLNASEVAAACLPSGFYSSPGLDILLTLYVAEEDARYLVVSDLRPVGCLSPAVTDRWIRTMEFEGMIDRKNGMLALSACGHAVVSDILERLYAIQLTPD